MIIICNINNENKDIIFNIDKYNNNQPYINDYNLQKLIY